MTEYQVQIENHMLSRKLSRDDQKPKGTIPNVNKIRHTIVESSWPKGDKDCYRYQRPIYARMALRQLTI
jgi:hypothetical protein